MEPRPAAPRPLLLPALLALVVAGTLLQGALTPRDLSLGEGAVEEATGDLAAHALSRVVTGAALLLSLLAFAAALLRRGLPRAGLPLWGAYLAYQAATILSPAVAGQVPGLDGRLLVAPVIFSAAWLARPLGPAGLVRAAKLSLGAFVWGSLLAAVAAPAHALAEDYTGLIPGLAVRLYGVGGGATSLGAQAAGALALEAVAPSRRWLRWLNGGASLLALFLTQSKTAWAFALAGAGFLAWRALERRLLGHPVPPGVLRVWRGLLRAGLVTALLLAGSAAAALVAGAEPAAAANLGTLTGRTYLWDTTVRLWLERPLFGHGTGLWDTEAFRAEHGQFAHAHNQLLHVLGSAGLVGLLGLAAYLRAAWRAAAGAARAFPAAPALLALALVQCLTEVPLRHPYLLDAHAVSHLLLFAALAQAAHLARQGAAT